MGTTLNEIVNDIGGGIPDGKSLKSHYQTEATSGGVIPKSELDQRGWASDGLDADKNAEITSLDKETRE